MSEEMEIEMEMEMEKEIQKVFDGIKKIVMVTQMEVVYHLIWLHGLEKIKTSEFGQKEMTQARMGMYGNEVYAPDMGLFKKVSKILENANEVPVGKGKMDKIAFVYNICVRFVNDTKLKGNWWSAVSSQF